MANAHTSLTGKTALITGGSSGIGLAITRQIYQLGAKVIVASNQQPDEVSAPLHEIAPNMENMHFIHADLAHEQGNTQLVDELTKQAHDIDILICNAGIQHLAPVHQFSFDKWNAIIALNLSSAFYLAKLLLPSMQRKKIGNIIHISSVHGLVASVEKAAYVAAKHGLIGLTKVIALENAEHGITCNAICPGFVKTPLVAKQVHDFAKQHNCTEQQAEHDMLAIKHPNKQFVKASDIAATVAFLCSPYAQHITGCSFPIDGGWTAQ